MAEAYSSAQGLGLEGEMINDEGQGLSAMLARSIEVPKWEWEEHLAW
jgi:hypothetical protein